MQKAWWPTETDPHAARMVNGTAASDGGEGGANRRFGNCWHGVGHGTLLHSFVRSHHGVYGDCSHETDVNMSTALFIDASTLCDDFAYLMDNASWAATLPPGMGDRWGTPKGNADGCHNGLAHATTLAQVAPEDRSWAYPCATYQPERETYQGGTCFAYVLTHGYEKWRMLTFASLPGVVGSECLSLPSSVVTRCIRGMSSALYLYHYYGTSGRGCTATPGEPFVPIMPPTLFCPHLGFGEPTGSYRAFLQENGAPVRPAYQPTPGLSPIASWCERFVIGAPPKDQLRNGNACATGVYEGSPIAAFSGRFPEVAAEAIGLPNCLGILAIFQNVVLDDGSKATITKACIMGTSLYITPAS